MQTDRVQVALRHREGLEAIDLGFAMARHWWRPLSLAWLTLVAPVGGVVVWVLRDHPYAALWVLWWLRPAFDRVPLHVLSRVLFGESSGLADTARALPSLLRSGIGTSLFLQRLSPGRTFLLPVLQLEGLRGAARRARCAALGRRDIGSAMALLAVGALVNGSLILGALVGVGFLLPDHVGWDPSEWLLPWLTVDGLQIGVPVVYWMGVSVVEPLLVAGGFALYVNRRVYLEGWDIDLAFRQLARRASASGRSSAAHRAAAVAALLLVVAGGAPARAQGLCDPDNPASAGPCVDSVLADPDFGSSREISRWRPREVAGADLLPSLGWLPELVASVLELMLWGTLAALLVAVGMVAVRAGERRRPAQSEPRSVPRLFGLQIDSRSLPPDLVGAARDCWARGAKVEALSLLYRGALSHWVERAELEIPASATELECLGLVRRTQQAEPARVFADVTAAWVGARYASRPPTADEFDALCLRFGPVFEASR